MDARALPVIVGLSFLLLLPRETESQAVDRGLGTVLQTLSTGSTIKVTTPASGAAEGRFLGVVRDSLLLRMSALERRVALSAIDTLWVWQRNGERGALMGAAIGAGALAVVGTVWIATSSESGSHSPSDYAAVAGIFGIVGGLGGAAIGSVLGAVTQTWRRVYPGRQ